MDTKPFPILHVDGSLTEYIDKNGILHQVAGLGGYLVLDGKIIKRFHKCLKNEPYLNHHEEYAVLEGMRWVKSAGFNTIKIKTDSMYSVSLFNNQKKDIFKVDKYFLIQYLALNIAFENVEIQYHQRATDDLAHLMSRVYLSKIPEGVIHLHSVEKKKKDGYKILGHANNFDEEEIKLILHGKMEKINKLLIDYTVCFYEKEAGEKKKKKEKFCVLLD